MPTHAPVAFTLSLAAVLLAACGPDTTTPVYVAATKLEGTDPTAYTVMVQIGDDGETDSCPSVGSEARLTVNGEAKPLQSFGEKKWFNSPVWPIPIEYCEHIKGVFVAHASADGIDRIVLQDGWTKVLDIEVRALLAERRLELVTPADGILHPDSDVTLRWFPDTDQPYSVTGDVGPAVSFRSDNESDGWNPIDSVTLELPLIHIHTYPYLTDTTGSIEVNPHYFEPLFLKCAGQFTTCNGHGLELVDDDDEFQHWVTPTVQVTVSST